MTAKQVFEALPSEEKEQVIFAYLDDRNFEIIHKGVHGILSKKCTDLAKENEDLRKKKSLKIFSAMGTVLAWAPKDGDVKEKALRIINRELDNLLPRTIMNGNSIPGMSSNHDGEDKPGGKE